MPKSSHWLRLAKKKAELDKANRDLETAEKNYDLNQAAILQHGTIPQLQQELAAMEQRDQDGDWLVEESVTQKEIAVVVAKMTGIPVTKLVASEREKLLHLADNLHRRVIGQDEAVTAVSDAVLRSRAVCRIQANRWGVSCSLVRRALEKRNSLRH